MFSSEYGIKTNGPNNEGFDGCTQFRLVSPLASLGISTSSSSHRISGILRSSSLEDGVVHGDDDPVMLN